MYIVDGLKSFIDVFKIFFFSIWILKKQTGISLRMICAFVVRIGQKTGG